MQWVHRTLFGLCRIRLSFFVCELNAVLLTHIHTRSAPLLTTDDPMLQLSLQFSFSTLYYFVLFKKIVADAVQRTERAFAVWMCVCMCILCSMLMLYWPSIYLYILYIKCRDLQTYKNAYNSTSLFGLVTAKQKKIYNHITFILFTKSQILWMRSLFQAKLFHSIHCNGAIYLFYRSRNTFFVNRYGT